jgi:hypothetical protein
VPANRHFAVVCSLNTRTHSGHICGTRDAPRRLATPPDACPQRRSDRIEPRRPCKKDLRCCPIGRESDPFSAERGSHHWRSGRRPQVGEHG